MRRAKWITLALAIVGAVGVVICEYFDLETPLCDVAHVLTGTDTCKTPSPPSPSSPDASPASL